MPAEKGDTVSVSFSGAFVSDMNDGLYVVDVEGSGVHVVVPVETVAVTRKFNDPTRDKVGTIRQEEGGIVWIKTDMPVFPWISPTEMSSDGEKLCGHASYHLRIKSAPVVGYLPGFEY